MAKVAMVSGYKPFELGIFQMDHPSVKFIKLALKKHILQLADEGLEWVLISGQLGTELWAAEVVFELQLEGYHELQLAVITPFYEQEQNWSDKNKEWYESVLAGADFIESVSHKPYEGPQQLRLKNQFVVEKSDTLVLFYDPEKEGSPKFLYEAAKQKEDAENYEIRQITFYDLQVLVEEEQLNSHDSYD
ncbi:MAG: DUF1273 domain-containing protein [Cytobacillus gottheilii]|uniref:DUF1273 domain-containing protein n=1 Tax=Cytobacillus gottheilii TaxID=859144 RepID=UPI003463BCC2